MKVFNENKSGNFIQDYSHSPINYKPLDAPLYYFRVHNESINGLNAIATLKSRIISNSLVFKLAKNNLKEYDLEIVRKQFF